MDYILHHTHHPQGSRRCSAVSLTSTASQARTTPGGGLARTYGGARHLAGVELFAPRCTNLRSLGDALRLATLVNLGARYPVTRIEAPHGGQDLVLQSSKALEIRLFGVQVRQKVFDHRAHRGVAFGS